MVSHRSGETEDNFIADEQANLSFLFEAIEGTWKPSDEALGG